MSVDPREQYPSTNWSLIGEAVGQRDRACREALNDLLIRYRPALQAHLMRKRRLSAHEADDLTQAFITQKILEGDLIAKADRQRGKFRNLLMKSLENYVANEFERRAAKKRLPDRAGSMPPGDLAWTVEPQRPFEVEWARLLLRQTCERMEADCAATDRQTLWLVFKTRILLPIFEGSQPPPYDDIVSEFGFRSPLQASNALTTAKRMFVRHLKALIGEYAVTEDEITEELRELHLILSSSVNIDR